MTQRLQAKGPFQAGAYRVPRAPFPIDLRLDGNEGPLPEKALMEALQNMSPTVLRQYPSTDRLEKMIAAKNGIAQEEVLITAGADDGIQRLCRAFLGSDCPLVLPTPTFEMIERFAAWEGARIVPVPWTTPAYPLKEVLAAVDGKPALIAMVSPNNPTGGWATADDLTRLSRSAPQALIMVDGAYAEFGTEDLTSTALRLPNTVMLRTFSKAQGLAGLRVGYAMGRKDWIDVMRSAGLPYPVSQLSLALAEKAYLRDDVSSEYIDRVARERSELKELLTSLGWRPEESQGNFIFARGGNSLWLRDAMAAMGIGIRAWPDSPTLGDCVRITCPGNEEDFSRLTRALEQVLAPDAILFDMDGVLADVSRSYRDAIVRTASDFGVSVTPADIEAVKQAGNANNDWVVTQRLLAQQEIKVDLTDIRSRFDGHYLGTQGKPGSVTNETMLGSPADLEKLSGQLKLGVVTGRPRAEAEAFLKRFGLQEFFPTVVAMEDAPAKPSPEPVRLALEQMGARRAWMIGDTPDDIKAARKADVLPVGVPAPGSDTEEVMESLLAAGAARILDTWTDLMEALP